MFADERAFQASSTINCFLTPFNRLILFMKASMMIMVTTGKSSLFCRLSTQRLVAFLR